MLKESSFMLVYLGRSIVSRVSSNVWPARLVDLLVESRKSLCGFPVRVRMGLDWDPGPAAAPGIGIGMKQH